MPPEVAPAPTTVWISFDEQDCVAAFAQRAEHPLDALLEVAAKPGAGEQRAQVEGNDAHPMEHRRHLAGSEAARDSLHDRGLADPRIAHQHRAVLVPAPQDLQGAVDFRAAADQRVEGPLGGTRRQIGGEPFQHMRR